MLVCARVPYPCYLLPLRAFSTKTYKDFCHGDRSCFWLNPKTNATFFNDLENTYVVGECDMLKSVFLRLNVILMSPAAPHLRLCCQRSESVRDGTFQKQQGFGPQRVTAACL